MKKRNYLFVAITFVILMLSYGPASAQCPGCVIDPGCTASPAKPAICPDTLPDGTAMQPYSEDISFYLPATFVDDGTGYTVTMNQLKVLSVSGLPYGLSFQTNSGNNTYYPSSNPPTSERGCAKICGTPLIAGVYTVTVFIEAQVTVFGLGQTVYDNFELPLTILPNPSSNSLFSITNPVNCAPLSTGFQNLQPSNGNPGYSYMWNFGNGNLSNLENPPAQAYTVPGNYVVNLQTTIDTLGYYLSSVSVLGATGCDDWPWSPPDFYFILKLGPTTIHTSPYIDNQNPPVTFNFSPIPLNNLTYDLLIYDYDDGLLGGDDYCGTVTFNGHNTGTHSLSDGTLSVSITITHPVIQQTASDTIKVFETPTVGNIVFLPGDSVCEGDSIVMSIPAVAGCTYQWYRDTSAILQGNDTLFSARQSGTYYCEVMNGSGCRAYTNSITLTFIGNPPKPNLWLTGNTINTNLSGYFLQWFMDGAPVSGASGMTYTISATGNYFLRAANSFGCTAHSDTILATYIGVEETAQPLSFRLFPNPSHGRFTIEMDLQDYAGMSILVHDLVGRRIYEEYPEALPGAFSREIDLSPAKQGIYIVTVHAGGQSLNQRISIIEGR